MSRLQAPGLTRATCPTCQTTGGAHVRATFPHFISLECNGCGKRWCADRITGAYVCSLDDFESPHGTALDPPEPVAADLADDERADQYHRLDEMGAAPEDYDELELGL